MSVHATNHGTGTVEILLAAYNGARFLPEQIDSILTQTHRDWRLLIRDDGSTDATPEIIDRYAQLHPDRIAVVRDALGNLGAVGNFAVLMERSNADYIMFCDQDDVWLADKVAASYEAMQVLEHRHGRDVPLLVHSDLTVVDELLHPIHPSFWRYQGLDPGRGRSLPSLLIQNVVTGCASMANLRLKDLALPLPGDIRMHDWWLALVAAAFGRIDYIQRPLARYRQHQGNTLGAKNWSLQHILYLGFGAPIKTFDAKREILRLTQQQAREFLTVHGANLPESSRRVVEDYAKLEKRNFIGRRITIIKGGFWLSGALKNAGLLLCI